VKILAFFVGSDFVYRCKDCLYYTKDKFGKQLCTYCYHETTAGANCSDLSKELKEMIVFDDKNYPT